MSINELKELQNNIIRKNKKCNTICISILLFIMVITLFMQNVNVFMLFFEAILGLIIITIVKEIINGKDIKKFNTEFKNIFVLKSLNNTFSSLTYDPDKGFLEGEIDSYGAINTMDRFSSNDYISGKYKDILFKQSDIKIEERRTERDSNGHTRVYYVTLFKGRYMIFDFNKTFKSNIEVSTSNFSVRKRSFISKMNSVKMEDIEFNKIFRVFADSDHEAFYILTPHFMEKLKNIYKELKCQILFYFLNNELHIAINNHSDSFEHNVMVPIDEEKINNAISKDIKLITDLVNELNLDNDLFKK